MNKRILYVEDHADTRDLICIWLSNYEYTVITASTAAEGLRIVRSEAFDIYILDNWLLDGSGIALCEKIRIFDKSTPILFLSGVADRLSIAQAIAAGAQAYLTKPIELQELSYIIIGLLSLAETDVIEVRQ